MSSSAITRRATPSTLLPRLLGLTLLALLGLLVAAGAQAQAGTDAPATQRVTVQ
jgi:hypothetical protein